ncbi:MAG: NUDIX domain-containing protein [Candidatus Nanohaloarchaea archaeon]|nr:NUDIX domain-containing protein [Candidatus Nanohaloarchaea archaeon]
MERPLPIVLAVIAEGDRYLLVHRDSGDFQGCWGFPGGKVERDEFIADAIEREVEEETGLPATFQEHLGVVSEHVRGEGRLLKHVPLHICRLTVGAGTSGKDASWFSRAELDEMQEDTVPSLVPILNAFLGEEPARYCESVITVDGEVERFRMVGREL